MELVLLQYFKTIMGLIHLRSFSIDGSMLDIYLKEPIPSIKTEIR